MLGRIWPLSPIHNLAEGGAVSKIVLVLSVFLMFCPFHLQKQGGKVYPYELDSEYICVYLKPIYSNTMTDICGIDRRIYSVAFFPTKSWLSSCWGNQMLCFVKTTGSCFKAPRLELQATVTVQKKKNIGPNWPRQDPVRLRWSLYPTPLLTHGRFRERPQRRRRSRPRGSECSSSVGGTSRSPERNLGNRKDHTALIIKHQEWRSGYWHKVLLIKVENGLLRWHHWTLWATLIWCDCGDCDGLGALMKPMMHLHECPAFDLMQ